MAGGRAEPRSAGSPRSARPLRSHRVRDRRPRSRWSPARRRRPRRPPVIVGDEAGRRRSRIAHLRLTRKNRPSEMRTIGSRRVTASGANGSTAFQLQSNLASICEEMIEPASVRTEAPGARDARPAHAGRDPRVLEPARRACSDPRAALAEAEPGTKLHERIALMQQTAGELTTIVRALQAFVRIQDEPPRPLSLGSRHARPSTRRAGQRGAGRHSPRVTPT